MPYPSESAEAGPPAAEARSAAFHAAVAFLRVLTEGLGSGYRSNSGEQSSLLSSAVAEELQKQRS